MAQESHEALAQVLDEQIAAAARLAEGLRAERAALSGRTVEDLHSATRDKELLFTRFEELEQERCMVCATLGARPDRQSMDALIAAQSHGARDSLLARWQRLMDLTSHCRDANETNGLIAQSRQRQLLQLLGLMRSGANGGATYGRTGVAAIAGDSSRAIATA